MRSARSAVLVCSSLLVLILVSVPVQARFDARAGAAPGSDAALFARLQRAAGGKLRAERHARTGHLRFVAPDSPIAAPKQLSASASPEQVARAFVATYGPLFGAAARPADLALHSSQDAGAGRGFVRFQQRYRGVPVLGGELIVQTGPANTVAAVTGELLPDTELDVQPRVDAATARQRAVAATARSSGLAAGTLRTATPELWIYDERILGGRGLYRPSLVWRTEVTSTADPLLRDLVLVDSQRGHVALAFSQVHSALDRRICNNNGVRDTDSNPTNNCDQAGEYVRTETGPASSVPEVNLAFDYSGDTYNFLATRFGRDSLDGAGLPLRSIVRYCPPSGDGGCPYENAFWNGELMVYGTGFAAADDVVGHELSHGLTDFTSQLFYYYQSGAINESFSDVFGELIDLVNGKGNDTPAVRWQIGEDLPPSFGVIRNMQDPTLFNNPDRMSSPEYWGDQTDSGGVHINSGVNNKAAFLLTDGGTFNGVTVQPLGIDKVARLYYEVESRLLTSAADYQDLHSALQQACQNLVGAGAMTAADCVQVAAAANATEMSIEPPAAAAPEAPVCDGGLFANPFWSDNLENPAAGLWTAQTLAGGNGWYYPPEPNPFGVPATYATSGVLNLWGDDAAEISDTAIAMTSAVPLPAGTWLRFNHAYGFEDDVFSAYDGGIVEYSVNNGASWVDAGSLIVNNGYTGTLESGGGNPLSDRRAFVRSSQGYYSSRLDLQSLAGQSVRFRFRIGTDESAADYGWFIDDVQLYTCAATPPPPPGTPPVGQRTFVPLVGK